MVRPRAGSLLGRSAGRGEVSEFCGSDNPNSPNSASLGNGRRTIRPVGEPALVEWIEAVLNADYWLGLSTR